MSECSAFLKHLLPAFARANPGVEMSVSPRPTAHPVIRATYVNGRDKAVCVRNLAKEQVLRKALLLRDDATGERVRDKGRRRAVVRPAAGGDGSVRGVWSPFHEPPAQRWKI